MTVEIDSVLRADGVFPVPLAAMQPGTLAPVNLYIRSLHPFEHYVLYKAAQTPLREEIRDRLLEHAVQTLYLRTEDEGAYYDYVEQNIGAIVRDDLLPTEKASEIIYKSSSRVMEQVFEAPRSGKSVKRARAMVEATVLSVMKNPDAAWHMLDMASHDYYTFTHCVNVAVFLVAAGRDVLGITDARSLERIGLGGIFHDIGKSQIPEGILNKPGRLSNEEFDTIKKHPLLGADIVSGDRRVSPTAAQIVRGHHEHWDGSGYPDGLADRSIGKVIRLSTIVDVYDAMTTNRPYADARDPYQALRVMVNEMASELDVPMLRSFVKFLGPRDLRQELRSETAARVVAAIGAE